MPLVDLLLHIESYPDPTPDEAIDRAVGFAATIGAKLSAIATHVDIRTPRSKLADCVVGLSRMAETAEAESLATSRQKLEHFKAMATDAGVLGEPLLERVDLFEGGECVTRHARTRDLCLVALTAPPSAEGSVAEAVIFGSGRPALVFEPSAGLSGGDLRRIVVAWDGSRCAARAVADALPLLTQAAEVWVLAVLNEKTGLGAGRTADLVRHLAAHGVHAVADEIDAGGRSIGEVLDSYLDRKDADLLVMGAYGHSRLREFILGGATEHMLREPKVPLLLAH